MIEQYITTDEVEQMKAKCHWLIDRFTDVDKLKRVYSFMNRIYYRLSGTELAQMEANSKVKQ